MQAATRADRPSSHTHRALLKTLGAGLIALVLGGVLLLPAGAQELPQQQVLGNTGPAASLAKASAIGEALNGAVIATLAGWHPGQVPETPLVWPASGPISNYFEPGHPLGIDIGLIRTPRAPILAAGGGIVVFAGGDACCSYGLHVIVDHQNGLSTLYAHLSRIDVKEGDRVKSGQALGLTGSTGKSTSEHLHFEVRRGEEFVDPLPYLPPHLWVEPEDPAH